MVTHRRGENALIRKKITAEMPLYAPLAGVHNAPMPPNAPMYAPMNAPTRLLMPPNAPTHRCPASAQCPYANAPIRA